jgi:hypothetical protein
MKTKKHLPGRRLIKKTLIETQSFQAKKKAYSGLMRIGLQVNDSV